MRWLGLDAAGAARFGGCTVVAMKFLVICRPRPGITPAEMAGHGAAEMGALAQLKADGILEEAYSPGGPGAILIFQAAREEVTRALAALPLMVAEMIDAEIIGLNPFPDL